MAYLSCSKLLSCCAPCFFKNKNSSTNRSLSEPFIDSDPLKRNSKISSDLNMTPNLLSYRSLLIFHAPRQSPSKSDSRSSLASIKEET